MTIWFGFVALWCLGVIGFGLVALVKPKVRSLACAAHDRRGPRIGLVFMAVAAWFIGPRSQTWKAEVERISTHIRQALEGRDG